MAGMLIPFTRRSHVATRQPAHGWHGWRLGCGWIGLLEAAATLASAGAMAPSRGQCSDNHLGTNPGGNLGTAQANPCCWLTPIGP